MEPIRPSEDLPEFAFYYPNPNWQVGADEGNWIKNLILFFDGVALLVPRYMTDRPFISDPAIAMGLAEHNLLRILEPETFIDQEATEKMANHMLELLEGGQLDHFSRDDVRFAELSYSRLGNQMRHGLVDRLYKSLVERGLAVASQDGYSVPMHPSVRSLILILWAQLLRPIGKQHGLDLQPATDQPTVHHALTEFLGQSWLPSSGHVVSLDLEAVGIDLASVPIDEVLSFRKDEGPAYRQYARNLRAFLQRVGNLSPEDQQQAMRDRKEEILDAAERLRMLGRQAWRKPAGFALGFTGAAWPAVQGDAVSAIVGTIATTGQAVLGSSSDSRSVSGAYSYLFDARRQLEPTNF